MKTFKDTADRTWTIAANIGSIKRVHDLANVDLLDSMGERLVEQLNESPLVVFDILWALVKPQADTLGVSQEQFADALSGDVVELATGLLVEELISFFPKGRRQVIGKAVAKMRDVEAAAVAMAEAKIDAMSPETIVASLSPSSSGSSPASSA